MLPFEEASFIKDGFTKNKENNIFLRNFDNKGKYILRYDAEYNSCFQQLIPYILVTDKKGEQYYISKRISGEPRLRQSLSLGVGGHINPCDGYQDVILKALNRELHEELNIVPHNSPEFLGYVRDLKGATSDHLGFVFTIKAKKVTVKEEKNMKGCWTDLEGLIDNYFKFESWAKYIIDHFYHFDNLQKNI